VTDELMISRVGQYESVLGTVKKRGKTRRPGKHLSHAMKLFIAVGIVLGSMVRRHYSCHFSWRIVHPQC
jgi:hypothetical protein